jgi:hypothetical protein
MVSFMYWAEYIVTMTLYDLQNFTHSLHFPKGLHGVVRVKHSETLRFGPGIIIPVSMMKGQSTTIS